MQEKINNTITISPNPATDVVNVSFTNNAAIGKVIVRVINPEGKLVMESATNNSFIHFDISNLPAGIYLAQAVQNGQILLLISS
ncbi:MAG: T9SS type A sorting domain-containing protein [Chitinophagaceae bacterium]|nr:T9SS type A sorting domain-containing protein [Chitinophagaceae bacterium]